jgi:hypothetical protein
MIRSRPRLILAGSGNSLHESISSLMVHQAISLGESVGVGITRSKPSVLTALHIVIEITL